MEEFIPWAMARPETEHYELVAGEIVAMAPERSVHARTKGRIFRRLSDAMEKAGLGCEAFIDGMAVQVDKDTLYEPDALVRCGDRLADDALVVVDPLIVVEVLSPSTAYRDVSDKLVDYFRIPSVRHYLIANVKTRVVVHHERDPTGVISTRIIHDGRLRLDPPGIDLTDIFEPEP
ncbi:MAG: Uma2 family endonuclease [Acetobacteraceae bacterium]